MERWIRGRPSLKAITKPSGRLSEYASPISELYGLIAPLLGADGKGPVTELDLAIVLHADFFLAQFLNSWVASGDIDPANQADRRVLGCLTALIALKSYDELLHEATTTQCVKRCHQLLEKIVSDKRHSKKEVLEALVAVKTETTKKIATVRKTTIKPFKFAAPPPLYTKRTNRKQNPESFFVEHYQLFVPYGLKPAQVRYHDENFYDTLQVWCTRHNVSFQALFDDAASREERRRTDGRTFSKLVQELHEAITSPQAAKL